MSQWLTAKEFIELTGYKTSRRQISVTVWGKAYEVKVYQKSKGVWEAAGSYEGESISVPGSSESSAIRHWEEAARYRG
jgi:hypothetical protein